MQTTRSFKAVMVLAGFLAVASAARADEARCNKDIDKALSKVMRAYEAATKSCLLHGVTSACPLSNPSIDKARNRLVARITASGRSCDDAINTGTPLSSLGPGDVCPDLDDCASTVGTISDLDDLATGDVRLLTMTAKGRVSGEVCPARVNVTEPALA